MITLSSVAEMLLSDARTAGPQGVAVDSSNIDLALALVELGFGRLETIPERRLTILSAGAAHLKSARAEA